MQDIISSKNINKFKIIVFFCNQFFSLIMKVCYIFPSALPSKNASSLQTAKMADALSNFCDLSIFLPNTGIKIFLSKNFII